MGIMDLGVHESEVLSALARVSGNVGEAVELLMEGDPPEIRILSTTTVRTQAASIMLSR